MGYCNHWVDPLGSSECLVQTLLTLRIRESLPKRNYYKREITINTLSGEVQSQTKENHLYVVFGHSSPPNLPRLWQIYLLLFGGCKINSKSGEHACDFPVESN